MNLYKKSNLVKSIVIIYIILFLSLLIYTFYRAEFIYEGKQFNYYYKYYLIFTLGLFFWILTLFLKEFIKIQIIIGSTTLIFLLYFYESYLTISTHLKIEKSKFEMSAIKEKLETIKEVEKKYEENVVPSIFPKALLDKRSFTSDIVPISGISNTITVHCKEGEEFSIYKSDRYGFNNPDVEWDNKKIEWFLVGDSFTHGSCVQAGEDFASQIRLLTKKSAINVGMSGNGPLIELASLKEYAVHKKPEIVLWIYFERNDLEDLKYEKSFPVFMDYLSDFDQGLYFKQTEIDDKLQKYLQLAKKDIKKTSKDKHNNIDKYLLFKKIIRLQIIRDKSALDRGLDFGVDPLFEKILINARDTINNWGGKLFFVYLPDKERYSGNNLLKNDKYLNRSRVINLVNNLNISIIDIHKDFFLKQKDPLIFYAHRIYGHYSATGYHKITKAILDSVKKIK